MSDRSKKSSRNKTVIPHGKVVVRLLIQVFAGQAKSKQSRDARWTWVVGLMDVTAGFFGARLVLDNQPADDFDEFDG